MDEKKLTIGTAVKSLMGHDRDRMYLIIEVTDGDFVAVADGDKRKIANPKKKRKKHLLPVKQDAAEKQVLLSEIENGKIKDERIKKALKDIAAQDCRKTKKEVTNAER